MRLGLTLPLRPAQTITSLVSNLAAFNGSQYAQDFAQDMIINWKGLAKGLHEEIDHVSELSGVPREHLNRYRSELVLGLDDHKSFRVAGETVSNRQFLRGRLRVCPHCLLADREMHGQYGPYTRIYWHISSIRTCHQHNTVLVDLPDAEFPRDMHDTFARIRDHWDIIEDAARDGQARTPSKFERYLVGRLDGKTADPALDDLPFEVIAKTSEMLGLAITYGPKASFSKSTDNELAEAGAAGFAAIAKGGDGINAALRSIQNKSSGPRAGHYTDFGHFARWLERMSHDDRYEPIRAIYRHYVFHHYPIGQGEVVLGEECPKRHLHSFATIANEFEMDPHRLKSFLGGFGFADSRSNRKPTADELGYFPAEESEARIRQVVDVVDRIEAAAYLNVNRPLFDRLRKIGVVQPVAAFDGLKGLYKPDHLDGVLALFLDRAEAVDELAGSRMELGVACNKAKVTVEQVVPLILDGTVKWLGKMQGTEGLASLAVDLEEILDLFEGPPLQGYTKQQLKRVLRVNDPTVTYLVNERYIRAYETRHPRSRRPMSIIPTEAHDAFLERYVTLGILANQVGTQAKHVSSRLERLKIDPIQLAPRFSKIYERKHLAGVLGDSGWITDEATSKGSI